VPQWATKPGVLTPAGRGPIPPGNSKAQPLTDELPGKDCHL